MRADNLKVKFKYLTNYLFLDLMSIGLDLLWCLEYLTPLLDQLIQAAESLECWFPLDIVYVSHTPTVE